MSYIMSYVMSCHILSYHTIYHVIYRTSYHIYIKSYQIIYRIYHSIYHIIYHMISYLSLPNYFSMTSVDQWIFYNGVDFWPSTSLITPKKSQAKLLAYNNVHCVRNLLYYLQNHSHQFLIIKNWLSNMCCYFLSLCTPEQQMSEHYWGITYSTLIFTHTGEREYCSGYNMSKIEPLFPIRVCQFTWTSPLLYMWCHNGKAGGFNAMFVQVPESNYRNKKLYQIILFSQY